MKVVDVNVSLFQGLHFFTEMDYFFQRKSPLILCEGTHEKIIKVTRKNFKKCTWKKVGLYRYKRLIS